MSRPIDQSTPRVNITVQGLTFACAIPFREGDTLTSGEASQLNQVWCENNRNNFAKTVDKARETVAKAQNIPVENVTDEMLDLVGLQASFDERVAEYQMGERRVGGGEAKFDPETREARKIARERIIETLKAKNYKLKSVSDEKMEELVSQLSARDDIVAEARRRLRASSKIAVEALNLDDLSKAA